MTVSSRILRCTTDLDVVAATSRLASRGHTFRLVPEASSSQCTIPMPRPGARLDALGGRRYPAFGNVDSERGIRRCAAHAGGRARNADGFWRIPVRWAMSAAGRISSIYRDGIRVVHSACRRETDVESGGRCLSDARKHPWTGTIYRDLPPIIELTVSAGSLAGRCFV